MVTSEVKVKVNKLKCENVLATIIFFKRDTRKKNMSIVKEMWKELTSLKSGYMSVYVLFLFFGSCLTIFIFLIIFRLNQNV